MALTQQRWCALALGGEHGPENGGDAIGLREVQAPGLGARCRRVMQAQNTEAKSTQTSIAAADPARLRNSNFWIFPVLVLGNSPKTTKRGTLNPAKCSLQC